MTALEAAEHIGGTIDTLRDFIRRGCVPSPLYVGGYPVFSREYVESVSRDGVSLDGTHPVTPSKWLRSRDPIPPAERLPIAKATKKRKHPLHGKPGRKPKGGA